MSCPVKVSVIMNCYNGERYLREALDSVFAQSYADFEVIFWDNVSTDGSGEIACSYREVSGGERVRYFRGKTTVPLGEARNLALDEARGEYVAFLDTDDMWLPEFLEKQTALIESDPAPALVYSDGFKIDGGGDTFGRFSDSVSFKRGAVFADLLDDVFIYGLNTVLVRKELLTQVGKFNEGYTICEDDDLFLRIADRGDFDFSGDALVKYRYHGENLSKRVDVSVAEWLSILDWWIERRPDLARAHPEAVMKRRLFLNAKLAVFYFKALRPIKAAWALMGAFKAVRYNPLTLYRFLHLRFSSPLKKSAGY